jgi:hypothetical protein
MMMKQKRFRPRLEVLEDRLVPATLDWTGATSSDWSDNTNWKVGSSVATSAPTLNDEARIGVAGVTITNDPQVGTSVTHAHYSVSKLESGANWTGTLLIYGSIACVNNDNTLDSSSLNSGLGFWKSGKMDFGSSSYLSLDPVSGTGSGYARTFNVFGGTLGSSNSPALGNIYVGGDADQGATLNFNCQGETLGCKVWDGYTGDGTTVLGTNGQVNVGNSSSTTNLTVIQNATIYVYGDQVAGDWTHGNPGASVTYGYLLFTGASYTGTGTVGGIDASGSTNSTIENKGYIYFSIAGYYDATQKYVVVKDLINNYQTIDMNAGLVYLKGNQVSGGNYDLVDYGQRVVRVNNNTQLKFDKGWNNSSDEIWDYGSYDSNSTHGAQFYSNNNLVLASDNIYANLGYLKFYTYGAVTNVQMTSCLMYVSIHYATGTGWTNGEIETTGNGANCTFDNACNVYLNDGNTGAGQATPSLNVFFIGTYGATEPTYTSVVGNAHSWSITATTAGGSRLWSAGY